MVFIQHHHLHTPIDSTDMTTLSLFWIMIMIIITILPLSTYPNTENNIQNKNPTNDAAAQENIHVEVHDA